MERTTRSLRTATYLLRFTPEEKAVLEQKVREAAAVGKTPLSLADALRGGANLYLDDLLQRYGSDGDEQPAAS
jgi:hypothetical protein